MFRKIFCGKRGVLQLATFILAGCSLSACANQSHSRRHSLEYFPPSLYGKVSEKRRYSVAYRKVGSPYKIHGRWYHPIQNPRHYRAVGLASWYGAAFAGRLTANGEIYHLNGLTAAHPTLPLPCYARVTNLSNGSSVIVRVNDRGPYVGNRVIDLSARAAELLGYKQKGIAHVKVDYVGAAPLGVKDNAFLLASYRAHGLPHYQGNPRGTSHNMRVLVKFSHPASNKKPFMLTASAFNRNDIRQEHNSALPHLGPSLMEKPENWD